MKRRKKRNTLAKAIRKLATENTLAAVQLAQMGKRLSDGLPFEQEGASQIIWRSAHQAFPHFGNRAVPESLNPQGKTAWLILGSGRMVLKRTVKSSLNSGETSRALPDFLRDMLASPPVAGAGVHQWIFKASRHLHAHLPAVEIVRLLESTLRDCGRHVPRREIRDAVKNALACARAPRGQGRYESARQSRWPAVIAQRVKEITADERDIHKLIS